MRLRLSVKIRWNGLRWETVDGEAITNEGNEANEAESSCTCKHPGVADQNRYAHVSVARHEELWKRVIRQWTWMRV